MAGPERILVDTGFFIALFNERDRHHTSARQREEWLNLMAVILPWPILYETVNKRLAKHQLNLEKFGVIAQSPQTVWLDDSPYRAQSFKTVLTQQAARFPLSLVDAVLCNIIEDTNVPVSAMLTFNQKDFSAVCHQHKVELL